MIHITRYHDISAGHRVVGHEGACASIHGHNYRIHFTCSPELKTVDPMDYSKLNEKEKFGLDKVGRVLDFSVVKKLLCEWLDGNWDHRFLVWEEDPWKEPLLIIDPTVKVVTFNPTAENLALFLIDEIGPHLLQGTGVVLTRVTVEETRKCSATVELGIYH